MVNNTIHFHSAGQKMSFYRDPENIKGECGPYLWEMMSELRPEGGTDKGLVIEESRERLLGDRA